MRFHLLAPASVQTTRDFTHNGFCQNVMWFARMLKEMGHTVFLYASEYNEAPCDELIPCISQEFQEMHIKGTFSKKKKYDHTDVMWGVFNMNAAKEIAKRKEPRDFICSISGVSQKSISDAHPDLMTVEYSIGYHNSWAQFKVFESYAMMHMAMGTNDNVMGDFFHTMIPNFFDPAIFTIKKKEPFALYLGRLEPLKGVSVACAIAEAAGIQLKIIGGGGDKKHVIKGAEYLGPLSNADKLDYLSRAKVLLSPTIYAEPFGSAAVEAQLSGTPVISTDFGAFTETVDHGRTGFRCNYLGEFVDAIHSLDTLYAAESIRDIAIDKYSLEAVKPKYQTYFERLMLLHDKGWDTCNSVESTLSHSV